MGDADSDSWVGDDGMSPLLAKWLNVTDWQRGEFSGIAPVDQSEFFQGFCVDKLGNLG